MISQVTYWLTLPGDLQGDLLVDLPGDLPGDLLPDLGRRAWPSGRALDL